MSGVSNGQLANETTFDAAFIARNGDSNTVGKLDLNNALTESGADIANIQRLLNQYASQLGVTTSGDFDALVTWISNIVGLSESDIIAKIEALVERFDHATGHKHTGIDGDGALISAADLADFNNFYSAWQKVSMTGAAGTTDVVTSLFTGKTADGDATQVGVLTDAPGNRVELIVPATKLYLLDDDGAKVYGRLTYAATVWTLSYYSLIAGVETAYSFAAPTDFDVLYRETFTMETRPTIEENVFDFISDSATGSGGGGIGTVFGAESSPIVVTPATGLNAAATNMDPGAGAQCIFVKGNSSFGVDMTASPQIEAGVDPGQQIIYLIGGDSVDYVTFVDGLGLRLNGPWASTKNRTLTLLWNGALWIEIGRTE